MILRRESKDAINIYPKGTDVEKEATYSIV